MSSIDPAVSSVLSAQQSALQQKISVSVTAKQLDLAKQQGDAMNALIESAGQLGKSLHSGTRFDAQA